MMNDNILVQFKIRNHKLLIEQGRYQIDHLSPATTPTTATTIIKQSFLMSKNVHSMNNFGYYCKFINIEQYNLTSLDTESLDND